MKNFTLLMGATFTILSLTACNQTTTNKAAADTQGNCSAQYVDSFNKLVADAQIVQQTDQTDTLTLRAVATTMDEDCTSFFASYDGSACSASVSDGNGGVVQVDTSNMHQFCDIVHSALNGNNTPAEMNASLKIMLETTSPISLNQ